MSNLRKTNSCLLAMLLVVAAFGTDASAQTSDSIGTHAASLEALDAYLGPIQSSLARVVDTAVNSYGSSRLSTTQVQSCQSFYQPFLRKSSMQIFIGFGYQDSENVPEFNYGTNYGLRAGMDYLYEKSFVKALTSPCQNKIVKFCGFRKSASDSHSYSKTVSSSDGASVTLNVQVYQSSLSAYSEQNVGSRKSEQTSKSAETRSAYLNAIQNADVVLYIGHSRDGGGPDFYPPRIAGAHVNYPAYRSEQRGIRDLQSALSTRADSGQSLPLLGVFSCLSSPHFAGRLTSASPETGFMLTNELMEMVQGPVAALATIDSLARFQCASGLQSELDAATGGHRVVVQNFMGTSSAGQGKSKK